MKNGRSARAALDQGQHVFALLRADEEVAVLAACGDALEVAQPAEPVGRQKGLQFIALQGVNTDMLSSGGCLDYQLKIFHAGISMSGWSERTKLPSFPSARTGK